MILFPSLCFADGQPLSGTFIGSADGDILTYECGLAETGRVTCSFVQVLMSKPHKPEEWEQERSKLKTDLKSEDTASMQKTMCEVADKLEPALKDSDDPSVDNYLKAYIAEDTEAAKVVAESSRKGCVNPSFENLEGFFYQSFIRDTLTCNPMVKKYDQTFIKVYKDVWTVESSPSGPCGIVNTSRLEQDSEYDTFWNYFSSKVITNKAGEAMPGVSCADLDEATYQYLWNAPAKKRDCVYLVFYA